MVFPQVALLLTEIVGSGQIAISPDTPLTAGRGVTPLEVAKLVMACERRFCITIQDEDVHTFSCLRDLSAYIDTLIADGHTNAPLLTDEDRVDWYYR